MNKDIEPMTDPELKVEPAGTKETQRRSVAKAITWRIVATSTTMAIVFGFTGKLLLAGGIGIVESISKILFYYTHERLWSRSTYGKVSEKPRSHHVVPHAGTITEREREAESGTKAVTVWFTGLTGSGKTTLAYALERRLFDQGLRSIVLDGENMRLGLCRDLGFDPIERAENVRRTAEVGHIANTHGIFAICGLISPFRDDRRRAKEVIGADRFILVHLTAAEQTLHDRARNHMYDRAEKGEIKHFTGVSDPYEAPEKADLVLHTDEMGIDRCVEEITVRINGQDAFEPQEVVT